MHVLPRWSLQVLGPLRICRTDAGSEPVQLGNKAAAVLAWLALRPDHRGPRASLLDLLWNESPVDQARTAMRQCLFNLREALGAANPVCADRDSVFLSMPQVDLDLARFTKLACGSWEDRLAACAAYMGDCAEELKATAQFDAWIGTERRKIRNAAARLLEQCACEAREATEMAALEQLAHTLLARDPLHEGCWRALMTLHSRCGLHAQTEAVWHECRKVLRMQAGVEPSAQTARLHASLTAAHPHAKPPAVRDDAEAAAHDHFLRGWQHYFNGSAADNAMARTAYREAAALVPGRSVYAVLAAWTHFTDFNFGWNGTLHANYRRAANEVQALLTRFPRDPWPRLLEAKLALWRGDWKSSLEHFESVGAALPHDARVWANYADALMRAGRTGLALQSVERAMELDPADRGFFHFVDGTIRYATGDLDGALESFRGSLRRNENYCVAYGGIAAVEAELGHLDEARAAASRSPLWDRASQLQQAMHVLGPYANPDMTRRWRDAWMKTRAPS